MCADELVALHILDVDRLEFLVPAFFPEFVPHRRDRVTLADFFAICLLDISICRSFDFVVAVDDEPFYLFPVGVLVVGEYAVPVVDCGAVLRHHAVVGHVTGDHDRIYPPLFEIVKSLDEAFLRSLVDDMGIAEYADFKPFLPIRPDL